MTLHAPYDKPLGQWAHAAPTRGHFIIQYWPQATVDHLHYKYSAWNKYLRLIMCIEGNIQPHPHTVDSPSALFTLCGFSYCSGYVCCWLSPWINISLALQSTISILIPCIVAFWMNCDGKAEDLTRSLKIFVHHLVFPLFRYIHREI